MQDMLTLKNFNICTIDTVAASLYMTINMDIAQSAGAVEYTDCFSADGLEPPQQVSWI